MAGSIEPGTNFRPDSKRELAALEEILLSESGRIVVVHGAPGSGKTSLTHLFTQRFGDQFAGGALSVTATGFIGELRGHLGNLNREQKSLLVIDEIERVPLSELLALTRQARKEWPLMSLLMTSRIPVIASPDTFLIEMPPLGAEELIDFMRAQVSIPRERLEVLAPLLEGSAEAAELASRRLASGVPMERILEWFESGRFAPARDPAGRPLPENSPARHQLDLAINEISSDLIRELTARPEMLYNLDPRKFEHLIAELYQRRGFETTLTPASGDEGVDVYVVSRNDLGSALWVVQAKRYAPERKIEAGVVRELLGTIDVKRASAGILITTSFFQPGAKDLERDLAYRLNLKDYFDLQELLRGTP